MAILILISGVYMPVCNELLIFTQADQDEWRSRQRQCNRIVDGSIT